MTRIQILSIVIAIIVGCTILVLLLINQDILQLSDSSDTQKSKQIETVTIERKNLSRFIDLDGILDYGNSVPISPSDSGVLTYIAPQGSELKRGSVIFRFYKSTSDIEKETNKQQIASAKAAVAAAELALENLKAPASAAQIASADAAVASAELALENLKAPASAAQIATANAAVASAELALENLKAPVTAAQIASADAAITLATINLVSVQGSIDVAQVSRRIARKALCDRAYAINSPDLIYLDSICPVNDIPVTSTTIKTLTNKMFSFSDDLMITRSNSLLNAHQTYQSALVSHTSAVNSLSSARNNREILNDLPKDNQLVQATESLNAAKEQQKVLSDLPKENQLVQATESLNAAKEQQKALGDLPSAIQLTQATELLKVAKEQRKALSDLPGAIQLTQVTESLKAAKEQRKMLNNLPSVAQLTQVTESLKAAKEQRKTLNNLPTPNQLIQAKSSLESAKSSLSTALAISNTLNEGTLASILMYGDISAWREFREGMDPGEDVKQLEENLFVLGYADGISQIDRVFDTATANAIKKMQDELGLIQTGSISIGDVVFLPGTSVVKASQLVPSLGINVSSNAPLLSLRTTEKIETKIGQAGDASTTVESLQRVRTSIEVADKELIAIGSNVKVELPDESKVSGTIREIGSIAVWPQGNQTGNPLLDVSVSIDGNIVFHQWTGAVVTVSITQKLVEGVLAVPIPSLVALLGGGYGLEILEGNSTKLVAVEAGVYDDGWVEVKGEGLAEGTKVVVVGRW